LFISLARKPLHPTLRKRGSHMGRTKSVNWLVDNIAGPNTTAPGGDDYENKHKVFVDFTEKYQFQRQQDNDTRIAPWSPTTMARRGLSSIGFVVGHIIWSGR
jgi:hypothetical protein